MNYNQNQGIPAALPPYQQPYPQGQPQQFQQPYPIAAQQVFPQAQQAHNPSAMANNPHQPLLAPSAAAVGAGKSAPPPASMMAQQPRQPALAKSVNAMMPTAPPLEACAAVGPIDASRIEQGHQAPGQNSGHMGMATSAAQGQFFTPQELEVLRMQQAPIDARKPKAGAGAPTGEVPVAMVVPVATAAPAAPVLVTQAGFPILARASSAAVTHHDSHHGVKSSDKSLNNTDRVLEFFQAHNSRPCVACRVHGYHTETRHRQVRRTDAEGKNERWETETYYETVTDFDYRIDLTRFIFPFGFVQSKSGATNVPDLIQRYLSDKNSLKSLQMNKEIQFDFETLRRQVHDYVRSIGWWRGLKVSFPKSNYTVRVYDENWMSTCWENECLFCLAHVTILPCIVMRCHRDCGDHFSDGLRSYFRVDYHPLQVFHMIRPMLWCTGYDLRDAAAEMFRDFCW
jgi:hypothetical protein